MARLWPHRAMSAREGGFRQRGGSGSRIFALALLVVGSFFLVLYVPHQTRVAVAVAASADHHEQVDVIINRPMPSPGCGKRSPIAAGTSSEAAIISSKRVRTYRLHVPRGYLPTHRYPLTLNFHGHSSTARNQEMYSGFSRLADQKGFIVAYPQGIVGPDERTGWASGGPNKPQINDVLFVSDLLTKLQSELCIDPQRIYATGFSNGGGLTSVLSCRMAGRIAAFASVSGSYFPLASGCAPGRPAPILEFHGTSDLTVPYTGRAWQNEMGAMEWVKAWAARDGCTHGPTTFLSYEKVTGLQWSGCQGGTTVIHYRLTGGVHVWPGAVGERRLPHVDMLVDATPLIWEFFKQYSLPLKG